MKVSGYGDMLSQVKGKPCLAYVEFGSYQGEWVAILDNGDEVELWKGWYGSCSGCDFIEAERDWDSGEIPDEKAREHFKETQPFLTLKKDLIKNLTLDEFNQIFPANIRDDIYDFEPDKMYNALMGKIKSYHQGEVGGENL